MAIRNRTHVGPSAIIPGRRDFIDTPTSRRIFDSFDWLRENRHPILIVGTPGVGKSTALRHIIDEDRHARLIVATPATAKLKPFLAAVSQAFGIYQDWNESTARIEESLLLYLGRMTSEYLIIDEAQFLDFDSFRTALFFFDHCGFPTAFVGNPDVLKRTRTRGAAIDQISDRLFRRVDIPGVTRQDVEAFGVAHNVEGVEAYELLIRFGLNSTLRQVNALLREASIFAGQRGSIRLDDLKDALVILQGAGPAKKFISAATT